MCIHICVYIYIQIHAHAQYAHMQTHTTSWIFKTGLLLNTAFRMANSCFDKVKAPNASKASGPCSAYLSFWLSRHAAEAKNMLELKTVGRLHIKFVCGLSREGSGGYCRLYFLPLHVWVGQPTVSPSMFLGSTPRHRNIQQGLLVARLLSASSCFPLGPFTSFRM